MRLEDESSASRNAGGAWLYIDELTHRTMNDYAIVLGTIELARAQVTDPVAGSALQKVKRQVNAAVEVHRTLQPPVGDAPRRLDDQLERLCEALLTSVLAGRSLGLTVRSEPVLMSARRCWQTCLIVSELVLNAARHAYAGREGGTISVVLRQSARAAICIVADDGAAPDHVQPGRGSAIVEALAADLGGIVLLRHTQNGSWISLAIPLSQPV